MSMPNRFALIERRLDVIEKKLNQEICKCGHNTNDHSHPYPIKIDNDDLECDECDCKKFIAQEKAE